MSSFLAQNNNNNNNSNNNNSINSIGEEPPAYSEENNNNSTISINISSPTTAHLSLNSPPLPTNPSSESLPSYDNVKVDIPPSYPTDSFKLDSSDAPFDLVPIEPQTPWPTSKKLYVIGFLLWPLWYIGASLSFFGKDQETRRWGRRCGFNAIIISAIFCYLITAYRNTINA